MTIATINPVYTAKAKVTGGRNGHGITDDGALKVHLKSPGASGDASATNPEQLFAVGYAACFQQALIGVGRERNVDVSTSVVSSEVSLGKDEAAGLYGLAVVLNVQIPGLDQATVQELANLAHEHCPYSRATQGNIAVQVKAIT